MNNQTYRIVNDKKIGVLKDVDLASDKTVLEDGIVAPAEFGSNGTRLWTCFDQSRRAIFHVMTSSPFSTFFYGTPRTTTTGCPSMPATTAYRSSIGSMTCACTNIEISSRRSNPPLPPKLVSVLRYSLRA